MKYLLLSPLLLSGLLSCVTPIFAEDDEKRPEGVAPVRSQTVAPIKTATPFEGEVWLIERKTPEGGWKHIAILTVAKNKAEDVERFLAGIAGRDRDSWRAEKRKVSTVTGKEWRKNLKFLDQDKDAVFIYPSKKQSEDENEEKEMWDKSHPPYRHRKDDEPAPTPPKAPKTPGRWII